MKIKVITVAMLSLLTLTFVGCQKEETLLSSTMVEQPQFIETIVYSIDGNVYTATLYSQKEKDDFFKWLFAMAKENHRVYIYGENGATTQSSKKVVTYVTTDEDEANKWAQSMHDQGYMVSIYYDDETGEFTCIAFMKD